MQGHFYLEYVGDADNEYQRLRLDPLPCTVGRSSDCEVQLSRKRISRRHARFEPHSGGLMVVDLDSTNGTFVNLERISSPTPIRHGDTLHFANHEYRLVHDESSGHTMAMEVRRDLSAPNQTVAGFTAEPTGFPVQAPQFYELLNEALVSPQARPIETADGRTVGLVLTGVSTHPRLNADHSRLQSLAEALGEEPRLNGMIREFGLEAAQNAGLDEATLFVSVQAGEIEDIDVLLEELLKLARTHRQLQLACILPPTGTTKDTLRILHKSLAGVDFELAMNDLDPGNLVQVAMGRELADYVLINANHGAETIQRTVDTFAGRAIQVIVDQIDDAETLARFQRLETVLLCGKAIGEPGPIT